MRACVLCVCAHVCACFACTLRVIRATHTHTHTHTHTKHVHGNMRITSLLVRRSWRMLIVSQIWFSVAIDILPSCPPLGCCHVSRTSDTAKVHNCLYATNGGFFNEDTGCCIGNLIVDGNVVEVCVCVLLTLTLNVQYFMSFLVQFSGDSRVSFGLTADSFVIGYMTNTTLKGGSLKLAQLIEGAGWIVRG